MKIIRSLTPLTTNFKDIVNCQIGSGNLNTPYYFPVGEYGELSTPVIYPVLASAYFGFAIAGEKVLVAPLQDTVPMLFDETLQQWEGADSPTFISPEDFLARISFWQGALSLRCQIAEGGYLASVEVGYSVDIDPLTYLLNLIPGELQKIPVPLSATGLLEADNSILLSNSIARSTMSKVQAKALSPSPLPVLVSDTGMMVSAFPMPVQVNFECHPRVAIADTNSPFQVEILPTVVIRPLAAVGQSYANFPVTIPTTGVWEGADDLTYFEDKPVELRIIAGDNGEARAIAKHIQRAFPRAIYAPGFDLWFPVWIGAKLNDQTFNDQATPSFSFEIKFLRLPG